MDVGCQRDVAVEMERAANTIGANFVVNTGDSFYDGGILTVNDQQIKTSFLNVYNQTILKGLQFFSVLGNHEYRGSVTAVLQIPLNYKRFTMDSRYYARVVQTAGVTVQLLFIDTSPMIYSYRIPGYDSPTDIILKRKDGLQSQWGQLGNQLAWLQGRLQNNRYEFDMRIVIGHHPIYDLSSHIGENRTFLQAYVAPLLEQYNVTAYFSGHDHNMQMVAPDETVHFVSGAGSKVTPGYATADTPSSAVQFYYVEQGFLACTIYNGELRVAVIDSQGNLIDNVIVKNRSSR